VFRIVDPNLHFDMEKLSVIFALQKLHAKGISKKKFAEKTDY